MTQSMVTNWWALMTTALGVILVVLGVAGILFGDGSAATMAIFAGAAVLSGALLLGGIITRPHHPVRASWLILAGSLLALTDFAVPGILALGLVGAGLWTSNLRFREESDELELRPTPPGGGLDSSRWYLWLITAVILFGTGLAALVILGDGETETGADDTSVLGGIAYFAWLLSWLGAVVSAVIGVVLAVARGIGRHRTRLA